jgi:hypothetical protein
MHAVHSRNRERERGIGEAAKKFAEGRTSRRKDRSKSRSGKGKAEATETAERKAGFYSETARRAAKPIINNLETKPSLIEGQNQ